MQARHSMVYGENLDFPELALFFLRRAVNCYLMSGNTELKLLGAIPGNLSSDTKQNKGDDSQDTVNGLARDAGSKTWGIRITEINRNAVQDDGSKDAGVRECGGEERLLGGVRAQCDGDGER